LGTSLVVFGPLLQRTHHYSGTFLLCNSSLFFWLCVSVLPLGHYVVAETGCNYHIHDINIFPLSKKSGRCHKKQGNHGMS
jgi:hypothetical protein